MTWQCDECGHENPDDAVVCEQCGELKDSTERDDVPDDLFEDEDLNLF